MIIRFVSWSTILEKKKGMLVVSRNNQGVVRALFKTKRKPNEIHIITVRGATLQESFFKTMHQLITLAGLTKTEISEMADDLQIPRTRPKTR